MIFAVGQVIVINLPTLQEVVQWPFYAVIHVVQFPGVRVGVAELEEAESEESHASCHGEVELHVVPGCGYTKNEL